jgi:hypothetical protein
MCKRQKDLFLCLLAVGGKSVRSAHCDELVLVLVDSMIHYILLKFHLHTYYRLTYLNQSSNDTVSRQCSVLYLLIDDTHNMNDKGENTEIQKSKCWFE